MRELIRSGWNAPRPAGAPARGWRDWLLVAVVVAAAVAEGVLRNDLPSPAAVPVLIGIGLAPTLLWRRTHPLLMVAIAFPVCALGEVVVGGDLRLNTLVFLTILLFSLARWGSGREAVIGTAIVATKIGLSTVLGYLSLGNGLAGALVVSAVLAIGAALRYRAEARRRELDQVKLLERERLARDLHDTVAHHVSAMAIRAQAGLAIVDTEPAAAADALRVIEAEASRALAEMRTMVRALRRDEPADRAPVPGVADLAQLTSGSGSRPGPVVEVELVGDLDALPPSVGAAVYRLAQESVTNAQRHARHATRIQVWVAADDTSVHLRVSDDGEGVPARVAGSPGYGLIGMIERADLLGGTVEAGPNPDRGWTVTATLPRTVSA
jgi:signal transduction histidine kinase